jgi:hypothetical protein
MRTLTLLQEGIHKLETTWGLRLVAYLAATLGCVLLLVWYDIHCYKNMAAPAAMDAAQLARNISRGKGYTTESIRPLSIYLMRQQHNAADDKDPARLNGNHPDLANPPVYPFVLAGLMKVLPFHFDTAYKGKLWSVADPKSPSGRRGTRYQPDFLIALFNQFLFVVALVLVFLWARRLFDISVARLSVFLLLGTEVLWRFTVSGLPTMLLMVIFVAVIWCLTLWDSETREPKRGVTWLAGLSLAAGALSGIGGLTFYSAMPLIVPVVLFLAVFGGQRRVLCSVLALVAFVIVVAPWAIRNYSLCGKPFGIADYNMIESFYPGFRLQRSLQPDLPHYPLALYFSKLFTNLLPVLQEDLFKMTGGWVSAFFLVGLTVGFRNEALRRLRYFVVGCVVIFSIAQAMSQTHLSEETPDINSENLLVVLAPMTMVYGIGLFYILLDGMHFPFPQMRYVAITIFSGVLLLPMIFALLSASKGPMAYPPYWTDKIQNSARLFNEDELIMSDIPWAVAWYGDRQCVWMTLNATVSSDNPVEWQESFYAINDGLKPLYGLYLTPRSLDSKFQSQWIRGNESSWGHFIVDVIVNGKVPQKFPLTKIPPGYVPEQLLLCDRVRW